MDKYCYLCYAIAMDMNMLRAVAYKNAGKSTASDKATDNKIANNTLQLTPHAKAGYAGDPKLKVATESLKTGGLIKVANTDSDTKDSLYRRVAKFLVLVGTDEAAKILPHLTQQQLDRIIPEIASIRHIDKDEGTAIFAEFEALLEQSREDGGVETARTILEKAFGKDKANAMLEKTVAFPDGKPFDYLKEVDSERITTLLSDESSSVRALILSQLQPEKAAAVINSLNADDKKDVVLRLARMQKVMPEVIKQVDIAMQEKLKRVNIGSAENVDGKGALAQILRRMDPQNEEELLDNIAQDNPDLGQDLRTRLFTTDDIIAGDDKYIQRQLHGMEDLQIVHLIAGKADDFRKKILQNVSQNRRNSILDTENFEKPFLKSDCERETSIFFSRLRRAYEDGEFIIKGRNEEQYVE